MEPAIDDHPPPSASVGREHQTGAQAADEAVIGANTSYHPALGASARSQYVTVTFLARWNWTNPAVAQLLSTAFSG